MNILRFTSAFLFQFYQFFGSYGETKHDWAKLLKAKSVCLEFYIFHRKQNWNIFSLRRDMIKKVDSVNKLMCTITQKIPGDRYRLIFPLHYDAKWEKKCILDFCVGLREIFEKFKTVIARTFAFL